MPTSETIETQNTFNRRSINHKSDKTKEAMQEVQRRAQKELISKQEKAEIRSKDATPCTYWAN